MTYLQQVAVEFVAFQPVECTCCIAAHSK